MQGKIMKGVGGFYYIHPHNTVNTIYECKENIYKSFPDLYEPYFFIIDVQTQRIQSMFIPDKTDPHTTQTYLNSINKKYFN